MATRREFLREAACFAGALAVLGNSAADARIDPVVGTPSGTEQGYPLPAVDGATVDRAAGVMLARAGAHVFALALACPHQNAAIRWLADEHRFQCSRHSSKYQPDGVYTSGRATRNLDRFPIRREGTMVYVDVRRVFRSDQDAAGWAAATVTV